MVTKEGRRKRNTIPAKLASPFLYSSGRRPQLLRGRRWVSINNLLLIELYNTNVRPIETFKKRKIYVHNIFIEYTLIRALIEPNPVQAVKLKDR